MIKWWRLAIPFLVIGLAAAASAVELVGTRSARFRWAPASGPVEGYQVYASTNGGAVLAVALVGGEESTLEGFEYGDEIEIAVRAMGPDAVGDFILGDSSPFSDPVRFVAPPLLDGVGAMVMSCATCEALQFRSIADGMFEGETSGLPAGWMPGKSADFDGDGDDDIVWLDPVNGVLVLGLLEDLDLAVALAGVDASLVGSTAIGAGDFDGDRSAEAVIAGSGTGVATLWGASSNSTATPVASLAGPASSTLVAVDDFDGDGHPTDLLWIGGALADEATPGTGGGTATIGFDPLRALLRLYAPILRLLLGAFGIEMSLDWLNTPAVMPEIVAGDVPSGDLLEIAALRVDLTTQLAVTGQVDVGPSVPPEWNLADTGDYDGDGDADLLWRDRRDGGLVFWLLDRGAFVEQLEQPGQAGDVGYTVVASHDFVLGGGEEVAMQHITTGRVVIVRPGIADRIVFADPGSQWDVVAVVE